MGLSKANRLKHRRDFLAVYEQGIRRHSPHLILRALLEVSEDNSLVIQPTCIGISISQKVSKKAVIRNRIKRQIRAAFRELLPYLPSGWKIVIVVKPKANECKYEHFLRELKQLLIEAEIIDGY
ncbi:ribonuclease P protein component [Stanieria sp. NIES-3757]|nr:ribonuclease P protein component [Stanieria sp. NIES-3757]